MSAKGGVRPAAGMAGGGDERADVGTPHRHAIAQLTQLRCRLSAEFAVRAP